jgi:hypothetical protein
LSFDRQRAIFKLILVLPTPPLPPVIVIVLVIIGS